MSDERPPPQTPDVTRLLGRMRKGEQDAFESLLPLVYDELKKIAGGYLLKERSDHTLQATAVVNEAYLRLAGPRSAFENRAHFFGAAARAMRQVLVDHARRRTAAKRPGARERVTLVDAPVTGGLPDVEILSLHAALKRLEEVDERKARVVELRYFAGMSFADAAKVLGVSAMTAKRDWDVARLMLRRWLGGETQAE